MLRFCTQMFLDLQKCYLSQDCIETWDSYLLFLGDFWAISSKNLARSRIPLKTMAGLVKAVLSLFLTAMESGKAGNLTTTLDVWKSDSLVARLGVYQRSSER